MAYDRRESFRHMLEHAGYATPPGRAACALELARAEELLQEAERIGVAYIQWIEDDEPWQGLFEPVGTVMGCIVWVGAELDPEHAATYNGIDPEGWTTNESLWGIDGVEDPRAPYRRVVQAELAEELEDELRQAIGDAKDTAMRSSTTAYRLATGIQANG